LIVVAVFIYANKNNHKIDEREMVNNLKTGIIPGFTEWQFEISRIPIIVIFVIMLLIIIVLAIV
jgi:hypothetical protein